jgi:thymidylate kinase
MMYRNRCQLLVVEGHDAAGKATQSKLLARNLQLHGINAVRVEVPCLNRRWSYRLIYWMLRNGWAKRLPNVFQLVQFANKLAFQLWELPKLARDHEVVVLDRWNLSSVVYGLATGTNRWFVMFLYGLLRSADRTLVLSGRSFPRAGADTYEADSDLQVRVKQGYLAWAEAHPEDCIVVRNDRTVADVQQDMLRASGAL